MTTTGITTTTTITTIATIATITTGATGTTGSSSDGRAGGEAVRSSGRRPSCIGRTPVLPDG
jgi:F0F1-type ATP synthase membrane subunit c/vacuolar-type H+-ATPase subunit K